MRYINFKDNVIYLSQIAKLLHGRSDIDTKNRFYVLKRAQKRASERLENKFSINSFGAPFPFDSANNSVPGNFQTSSQIDTNSHYDDEHSTVSSKGFQSFSSNYSENHRNSQSNLSNGYSYDDEYSVSATPSCTSHLFQVASSHSNEYYINPTTNLCTSSKAFHSTQSCDTDTKRADCYSNPPVAACDQIPYIRSTSPYDPEVYQANELKGHQVDYYANQSVLPGTSNKSFHPTQSFDTEAYQSNKLKANQVPGYINNSRTILGTITGAILDTIPVAMPSAVLGTMPGTIFNPFGCSTSIANTPSNELEIYGNKPKATVHFKTEPVATSISYETTPPQVNSVEYEQELLNYLASELN